LHLHQKIEIIDSTPELQSSIKNYKKDIETRANELEAEVKWLREELKAIRDLLGLKLQNSNSGKY
jgi:LPS O-antigen subunit length determinant protein (WzzB/FepE family)